MCYGIITLVGAALRRYGTDISWSLIAQGVHNNLHNQVANAMVLTLVFGPIVDCAETLFYLVHRQDWIPSQEPLLKSGEKWDLMRHRGCKSIIAWGVYVFATRIGMPWLAGSLILLKV